MARYIDIKENAILKLDSMLEERFFANRKEYTVWYTYN